MKFIGAHIFDYDATFRSNVGIGTNNPQELVHIESTEPIIRFDDTNSGIHYLVGQVGDAFVFDTNNPAFSSYSFDANLSVTGTINLETSTSSGLPSFIIKDNARSGSAALNYIALTDSADTVQAKIGYLSGLNTEFTLQNLVGNLSVVSSGQMNINSGSDTVFLSSSSEKVRIKSNGKVGVGLNNPSRQLEVASTSSYVATLNSTQNNSFLSFVDANTSGDTFVAIGSQTGDLIFIAGNTERARINTDGKFGIGTSSPNMPLSIESSNDFLAFFKSTDNKGFIGIADNDTTGYISAENDTMSFGAATGVNANNLNINLSNNNVGIGTSSIGSAYKLDVNGKAKAQSLELTNVLTLTAISTPADPGTNQSSIYMDSADGAIRVKINVGGTTVTRTLATFE